MGRGIFITFEGGEGAGKSSVLKRVVPALQEKGYEVIHTREPGGISISEQIRSIILDVNNTEMDYRTEALLYAAARRQHLIERIIPALLAGRIVLCDRFIDSSFVYQGYARGIGFHEIKKINDFALNGYMPDLTLYFDVEPEVGLKRIHIDEQREQNRLDQENIQFHKRVRDGYKKIHKLYGDRIKKINANATFEQVYRTALSKIIHYITANNK